MKPFEPNQIKTFRTPKYTGVTLSLLSIFVLASMIAVWNQMHSNSESKDIILSIICENSLQVPVNESINQFKKELNTPIKVDYYSKVELHEELNSIPKLKAAKYDLLISSNSDLHNQFFPKGLINESIAIANYSLVFATRQDSKLKVENWPDLLDQHITFGHCDQNTKSGKELHRILELFKGSLSNSNNKIFKSTEELTNELMSSSELDGILIWYSTARKLGLKIYPIEEFELNSITVTAKVISSSKLASKSLMFARFLAAPTRGQFYLANNHLMGVDGDIWSKKPVITIYSEPDYENLLIDPVQHFEEREGAKINLLFPRIEKLIFTISSITQSNAQNLLPDLLLVSKSTAEKIPSNYTLINSKNSFSEGIFFLHQKSKYRSLSQRLINYKRSKK